LRDSYPATIISLPRSRIPILTVAGLIEIAALHVRLETNSEPKEPLIRVAPAALGVKRISARTTVLLA